MSRILLFVHYNKYNGLSDYILYLLDHIKNIYSRVVFISNSPISNSQKQELSGLFDLIFIRENKGFDFGAWKDAILDIGFEALSEYDNITLMNDTCFGPLFDMKDIYEKMENKNIDFWGMTNYRERKQKTEHLQRYFMCFNKNVIQSSVFKNFWGNVEYEVKVSQVINKYEINLTSILAVAGFKYLSFFDTKDLKPDDGTLIAFSFPNICIKSLVPLIKVKSFIYFPYPKYIFNLIEKETNYPVQLIHRYFSEIYDPNTQLSLDAKFVYVPPSKELIYYV